MGLDDRIQRGFSQFCRLYFYIIETILRLVIVALSFVKRGLSWVYPKTGFQKKTLWDWLGLLIVPVSLALIGLVFAGNQDARQNEIEATRQAAEIAIEDNRTKDNILESYLDDMTTLILQPEFASIERGSCGDMEVDEITNPTLAMLLARSRTLLVSSQLDGDRLAFVVRFLFESELFRLVGCDLIRTINMSGLDLHSLDLSGINWHETNLQAVDLTNTDLRDANLRSANLQDADLKNAKLQRIDLYNANLRDANLRSANLQGAYMRKANLQEVDLIEVNLQGATMSFANLRDANLTGANLRGADFDDADLQQADLRDALFAKTTELPDGTYWTDDTDMTRFTNPEHPDFWRSNDPNSPAYGGDDGDD